MKKKALIISSVCSVFLGSTAAFADGDAIEAPSIEKAEKKFSAGSPPHPIFSWNSPIMPVSGVLHPGSARGAGMVEAPLREIDQVMDKAIADKVMPGAVAFVARGGHIVKNKAYGHSFRYTDGSFTETPNPIQMQENTIFDLASVSKIFTSTAFMILHEQGLVKLDDPVMKYIPEFAQNGKEKVTVRQLLTHTSGFVSWIPLYSKGSSRDERMQLVFKQPLSNQPGTKYTYSDLNMITLGAIIERLSGMRQDEFVKKYITDPLGMEDTMYNPPASLKNRIAATEFQKVPDRGLVWGQVHDENAWSLDGVAGHAGVFSTASDLAKLAHIFLNEGRYGGKRILKSGTVKLLLENQNQAFPGNDHGLGWELGQGWYMDALSDSGSFGHTGYTGTSIVVNPKLKTIAILLTNRVHPTRTTVSTNQTRRLFARQVADSIPVAIPGKKSAWFAGYGDKQTKVMEADLTLSEDALLTYNNWYSLETNADYGRVEILKDGSWQKIAEYTGGAGSWDSQELLIPKEAEKIRFSYTTDGSVNGRGWYVQDAELNHKRLDFSTNQWELRDY
ncbi:serine hydrolase domain-containing protein [Peribacillus deserti]|uniref:Serine hydrolase n=1 Tax=Peribacillus deserti TaxID=673318 RepID=A0A2N5M395_9BACI|nr:serine hydrolase domain-containing protein [Peribacillus deserti]PLT28839.1 serine hydrolase [Peribacillus deserti]